MGDFQLVGFERPEKFPYPVTIGETFDIGHFGFGFSRPDAELRRRFQKKAPETLFLRQRHGGASSKASDFDYVSFSLGDDVSNLIKVEERTPLEAAWRNRLEIASKEDGDILFSVKGTGHNIISNMLLSLLMT